MSESKLKNTVGKLCIRWLSAPRVLVLGLFVVEAALLLSERYRWFPFSGHAGWGALFAVGAAGIAIMLLLGCFPICLLLRWRFQFRLRLLLALSVAVAIPFNWLATEMQRAKRQRAFHDAFIEHCAGGLSTETWLAPEDSSVAAWFAEILGEDFLQHVDDVGLAGEEVDDTWLERLAGLPQLRRLELVDASVTEAGLRRFRMALPECVVEESTTIADIRGCDRLTMAHVSSLLQSQGVTCGMILQSCIVTAPKNIAATAAQVLREDAKKLGYWIRVGDDVENPSALDWKPQPLDLPIANVLAQPEYAENTPVGHFLRSSKMATQLQTLPFVTCLGVRRREYLAAPGRWATGYDVQIGLARGPNDPSQGQPGWYSVFAE